MNRQPPPEDVTGYRATVKSLQVWITPDQRKALKIQAAQDGVSVSEIVRVAIDTELRKRNVG